MILDRGGKNTRWDNSQCSFENTDHIYTQSTNILFHFFALRLQIGMVGRSYKRATRRMREPQI